MVSRAFFCPIFSAYDKDKLVKMNDEKQRPSFWVGFAKVFLAFLQEGAYNMS